MRWLPLVALVGCAPPSPPPAGSPAAATHRPSDSPTSSPPASSPSPTSATPPSASGCTDVASDLATRAPGAKPDDTELDLDGDGVFDPVFVGYCSMMGGNCETYLYASNDGCARYVGVVTVTRVSSGPTCAAPPHDRVPCRLSASRMMIHGEIYEYFYEYGDGGYVEAGVGFQGERRER